MTDWTALNRDNWNERAIAHAGPKGYRLERWRDDPAYLSEVVVFDLPRLGDLTGLNGVHLQCHLGTDTLSLHRLGARMTGLDFSGEALEVAREMAAGAIDYVEADLYDAPKVLPNNSFDFIFTGIGALCWLPDIERWGQVVASLLKPGGRLFLRDGHPVMLATEVDSAGQPVLTNSYFERAEPSIWDEPGTYVETDHEFVHTVTAEWNHGIGEIVTALLNAGMRLTLLEEHDTLPSEPWPGVMEQAANGEYRLADRPWRMPHSFTLHALKP